MIFAIVCVIFKISFIDWFNCMYMCMHVCGVFAQACGLVCDVCDCMKSTGQYHRLSHLTFMLVLGGESI